VSSLAAHDEISVMQFNNNVEVLKDAALCRERYE